MTISNPNMVPWLRSLAEKGGKGGVTNVDARSLGRVADELERQSAENARMREALVNLLCEARGCVDMARECIGNTNANCLERRCKEADKALSTASTLRSKDDAG